MSYMKGEHQYWHWNPFESFGRAKSFKCILISSWYMTWMTFLRIIELAFDGFSVETDLVKEFRNMVGNFLYIISSLFSMNYDKIYLKLIYNVSLLSYSINCFNLKILTFTLTTCQHLDIESGCRIWYTTPYVKFCMSTLLDE